MERNVENVIEFLDGDSECAVSFTNRRFINRMVKLYEQHKPGFKYLYTNQDGSITARIPLSWIKIIPPREISEEEREKMRERFFANLGIEKDE